MQPSSPASRPTAWRRVRAITALGLVVWFGVTFVTTFFARDLDLAWFGWPLHYWIASQGALVVYLVLIAAHAWAMGREDDAADAGRAGTTASGEAPYDALAALGDAGRDPGTA